MDKLKSRHFMYSVLWREGTVRDWLQKLLQPAMPCNIGC